MPPPSHAPEPGSWVVSVDPHTRVYTVLDATGATVATHIRTRAIARQIAAAPALLAILRDLLPEMTPGHEADLAGLLEDARALVRALED